MSFGPPSDERSVKPRRPWLAAILSLLGGPVGQIYAGEARRSIVLWTIGTVLSVLLIVATISLPIGRSGLVGVVLVAIGYPVFLAIDASRLATRNRHAPLKRYQRWWAYAGVLLLFLTANSLVSEATRAYLAEGFVVPGHAMSPTIRADEHILVDKLWSSDSLQRNDLVVFHNATPEEPAVHIKRVVGLPGDEITVRDERVLINGEEWHDSHAVFDGEFPPIDGLANYGPVRIPLGSVFLLGDNRRRSYDSRMHGPVPLASIFGKARMIYWSRPLVDAGPRAPASDRREPIQWRRIGTRLD